MNLEDFKKMTLDDQKNYDFKDTFEYECLSDSSKRKDALEDFWKRINDAKNDPIKKLGIWKHERYVIKGQKKPKITHDCDSTKLALSIMNEYMHERKFDESEDNFKFREKYNNVYVTNFEDPLGPRSENKRLNFIYELSPKKDFDLKVSYKGDTMNSFQTIANISLCKLLGTNKYKGMEIKNINTFKILEELLQKNKNELQNVFKCDVDVDVDDGIEILKKLEELAKLTHTIGNFFLVPKGTFNGERFRLTEDFFDLTLEGIRQYYLEEKHTPLCGLLRCIKQNKAWLDSFKSGEDEDGTTSWFNFVKLNFLDDYVDTSDVEQKYPVIMFYEKHSFYDIESMSDIEPEATDLLECLTKMCNAITERSVKICEVINK